jgi:hypothetical protein
MTDETNAHFPELTQKLRSTRQSNFRGAGKIIQHLLYPKLTDKAIVVHEGLAQRLRASHDF